MKEVTIDNVRERIARIEECASRMPFGLRLSMNTEFELACLRQLLASLEAEAVGFIARHKETGKFGSWLHPKADWFKSDEYETLKAYTAPPAPVATDATPSLNAMMRALDAFYADDEVPERGMLAAFKILLADVGKQPAPVVRDEHLLQSLETRINSLEIGERKGALSTQQATSLKAYRLAVQCLRSSATSDENATDNTAQQFESLAENTEPCVICGVVSSHPEGWHYCHATSAGSGKP